MSDSTPNPAAGPGGEAAGEGLDPKVGGLLAYLLFGWVGGLIMFLTQKHPEVRFHGMQSILLSVAILAVYVALTIVSSVFGLVPGLGFVAALVTVALIPIVGLASLALWILLCVKGYALEHFKLPFIGDFAEQWSGYRTAA